MYSFVGRPILSNLAAQFIDGDEAKVKEVLHASSHVGDSLSYSTSFQFLKEKLQQSDG